jgi:hypothetical protein
MGKLLLNLTPCEPLSLVKKFPYFDDLIELEVLLVGAFHFSVHDSKYCLLFNVFMIYFWSGQVLSHVRSVQERWKIWSNKFNIKYGVQAKKRGNN